MSAHDWAGIAWMWLMVVLAIPLGAAICATFGAPMRLVFVRSWQHVFWVVPTLAAMVALGTFLAGVKP